MSNDSLDTVADLVGAARWEEALSALDAAGSEADTARGIELRAVASYGAGEFEACITAWERLHGVFEASGDRAEAARAAAMIAMYLMMDTGLMAPVRGWLRRAESLVDEVGEVPASALIAMVRTYERFMSGDMAEARVQSDLAIELGGRLGVVPAVVIGRVASARVTIYEGRMEEGLAQLDEIGSLLMSGGADSLTTGMMYCELICAAQGLGLHAMANEWTDVMEHWRHGAAFGGINGRCRVHRAEMLRVSGPGEAAEAEALGACDDLRPWMRREYGWPLAELGNIRLRRGDLDGAEEAFLAAHEHAWSPQPGLALVHFERGHVDRAMTLLEDAIAHPVDIPSKERPPFGELRLAPLYEALGYVAYGAGDSGRLRTASEALTAIACDYPTEWLQAAAAVTEARAALLCDDWDSARARCATAISIWTGLGAPYEVAVARMVLAEAYEASGNIESARMELAAAHKGFEAFGARLWARRAVERSSPASTAGDRRPPDTAATQPAETPESVFGLDGDLRTVTYAGETVHLRDLTGFRHVERLLSDPGREFHVLDLVVAERGAMPVGAGVARGLSAEEHEEMGLAGAGLPVLDEQARRSYQRRLEEVEADIEEARAFNDLARAELAERDRDYLIAELRQAVGLSGRHRSVGSDSEKARTSITRSIRYALKKLAEHHPAAADHLDRSIRTGSYCCYSPDPTSAVEWRIRP